MLSSAPLARLHHRALLGGSAALPGNHAVARGIALGASSTPAVILAFCLWRIRHVPVEEIATGPWLLIIAPLSTLTALSICWQPALLAHIDRLFYREPYDTRQAFMGVLEGARSAGSPQELSRELLAGLDDWLHIRWVTLLLESRHGEAFEDPLGRGSSLDSSSPLLALVSSALQPLPVEDPQRHSPGTQLTEDDRSWLEEGGFSLLVPVVNLDGRLTALVALGPKRSGLPYDRRDLELLQSCAHSLALLLEARGWQRSGRRPSRGASSGTATGRECPRCQRVFTASTRRCRVCHCQTVAGVVPPMLGGRLRIDERIGSGGMGIVYRGVDLTLERPVAVKTLTRVRPTDALRLRREARALAAVSHGNLATIYGLLDWQGVPLLVLELLEGGALTDHLAKGPLCPRRVLEIGAQVALGLEGLHHRGILHRDIKPSNIAFTADGTSKLLDFGLARFFGDRRSEPAGIGSGGPRLSWVQPVEALDSWTGISGSHQLVGTLPYLSPEAVEGDPPDPSQDIWALCVVLWEALSGQAAFDAPQLVEVLQRIRQADLPPIGRSDLPAAVHELFAHALHRDPGKRPATASELHRLLLATSQRLAA